MRRSKELRVGLLAISALAVLFIGGNFLKGEAIFGTTRTFHAEFNHSSGLHASDHVLLNGVKIGRVLSVELNEADPSRVGVSFNVDQKKLQIPKTTKLKLITSSLLGTKALELVIPFDSPPLSESDYYQSGDTFNIVETVPSVANQLNAELSPLKEKTEHMISSIDHIATSVGAFWDTSAVYTIDASLREARNAIAKIGLLTSNLSALTSNKAGQIGEIVEEVNTVTHRLAEKSDKIAHAIDNLSDVSDALAAADLKTTFATTKQTLAELNEVVSKVNKGEGTLGLLLHTDSLHNGLIQTNRSLQNLLEEFRQHPNKFVRLSVFGRKVKGYQTTREREKLLDGVLDSLQGIK